MNRFKNIFVKTVSGVLVGAAAGSLVAVAISKAPVSIGVKMLVTACGYGLGSNIATEITEDILSKD